jgi:hypothetical protein
MNISEWWTSIQKNNKKSKRKYYIVLLTKKVKITKYNRYRSRWIKFK